MNRSELRAHDPVARPRHYTFGGIEVIDAIEAWGCDFVEGNIIKYVARWKHKDGVTDLRKAAWYLNRLINRETDRAEAGGAEKSADSGRVIALETSGDRDLLKTNKSKWQSATALPQLDESSLSTLEKPATSIGSKSGCAPPPANHPKSDGGALSTQ